MIVAWLCLILGIDIHIASCVPVVSYCYWSCTKMPHIFMCVSFLCSQPVGWSLDRSVSQSNGQSAHQSINQSIPSVSHLIYQSLPDQSISHSVSWSVSHSVRDSHVHVCIFFLQLPATVTGTGQTSNYATLFDFSNTGSQQHPTIVTGKGSTSCPEPGVATAAAGYRVGQQRGGRQRQGEPPSHLTEEQRRQWEKERQKKDSHNVSK